ncbi:MAG: DPP IV N-terminal domain-containing protein, partial [Acidobacteria bacterium]|nr:DPP IV N-terminal domain-containing protein [Acidobacteriota bacterium]
MKKTVSTLFALLSLALACAAQEANAPIKPEQVLGLRGMRDVQISPDGGRVAFTVTEPPKGNAYDSDVWVFNTRTRELRRYTTAPKTDAQPRWSPDSRTLAFVSNRDGAAQIYLLPADGGEATKLTESKTDVGSIAWSPDGKRIAYAATDAPTDEETKK